MKKIIILLIITICYGGIECVTYAQSPSNSLKPSLSENIEKLFVDFENALKEEEKKMPPLYDNIQSVKRNLDTLKRLIRTELQNAGGFQIDYVPQYEIGNQEHIEKWAHDSIERYQSAVKNFLIKRKYDLIGWEASTLDMATHKEYVRERLGDLSKPDSTMTDSDAMYLYNRFTSPHTWQDGVLAYWVENPKATLIGLGEKSTWRLNLQAMRLDPPFSYYVAELRTYIAMARMIRAVRGSKLKQPIRAVVVMGAWHQTDVTFICKELGIKMNILDVMAKP